MTLMADMDYIAEKMYTLEPATNIRAYSQKTAVSRVNARPEHVIFLASKNDYTNLNTARCSNCYIGWKLVSGSIKYVWIFAGVL